MNNFNDRPVCHRADDMIGFLYGEATKAEAADFSDHMMACASCQSEFALLTSARQAMSQWRSDVLGSTWVAAPAAASHQPLTTNCAASKPVSALTAIREFFTISPLWLRGATAMAAVLFCLIAGLFAARMLRAPEQMYTQDEVNARLQRQLDDLKKQSQQAVVKPETVATGGTGGNTISPIVPAFLPQTSVGKKATRKTSRPSLSREERQQLAADLRLETTATDDDALSFLLDGGGSN
jgi:anti-sigma factor RsiW